MLERSHIQFRYTHYSRCLVIAGITILISNHATSALTPSTPLEQLIEASIPRGYTPKLQTLTREKAANTRLNPWTNLLPSFSATAGKVFTQSTAYSTAQSMGLAADWTLWDGYKNIREVTLAELDWKTQKIQSDLELQNYLLELIDQFMGLEVFYIQRSTLQESLKNSLLFFTEARELARLGAKTKLDVMDTEIQVQNFENDLFELENSITGAERNFSVLLNTSEFQPFIRTDFLKTPPYFMEKFEELRPKLKRLEGRLGNTSPDLRVTELKLSRSLQEYEQTRLSYFPLVSFKIAHDRNYSGLFNSEASDLPKTGSPTSTATLNFSWTIWDWLNTPRNIWNSKKNYQIEQLEYDRKRRLVNYEVQTQLERYEILEKNVTRAENVVTQAELQMEYTLSMYQLGRITLLQAQTSRERLSGSRNALVNRLKAKYLLAARILIQAGQSLLPAQVHTLLLLDPAERPKLD